jgi:hypothetical protein
MEEVLWEFCGIFAVFVTDLIAGVGQWSFAIGN